MVDRLFSDAYLAGLYDVWHPREVRDDFDFYMPRVMAAKAVLDVGCGTGMMLHDARDRGHAGRLCGLDPAEGMLARARRRTDVEWVLGDLVSAGFEDAFDLVVMTGHAFQTLVEDDEIAAALAAVRRALTADGRFAFETRHPAARAWEQWRPERAVEMTDADGRPLRITTEVVRPFDGRTVSFTHTFTGPHPALPMVSRSTLRFLDPAALAIALEAAGLAVEAEYGDWDGGALGAASPEIIVLARRA
ncbi:MAG: class I SAM-dependent methyltransferase [Phenylobacterium sp.]|uniref:class I SAM-dependent methyltransferase n=1 Tax=Phenylobacterium sp. TaxID=1871053 RepID=UPI00391AFFBF